MGSRLAPLAATIAVQITGAFLLQAIPVLSPALAARLGLGPALVGQLAPAASLGTVLFLLAGTPVSRRMGPVRCLQIGGVFGALGMALLAGPFWSALALGSLLIGLAYGPTVPASSEILLRFTPPHRRSLVFSIKQAGVPVGGVLAGLILPALVVLPAWWLAIALGSLLSLAPVLAIQPLRERIDASRDRAQPLSLATILAPRNLLLPLRAIRLAPELPMLTAAACLYGQGHAAVFSFMVTFLVDAHAYPLASAGLVFAIMQGASVAGRVLLGWAADRGGSGIRTLALVGPFAALAVLGLALIGPATPFWLVASIAALAGASVGGWIGVYLAEVARSVPIERVGEATAGTSLITFAGYTVGPALFALALKATGGYGGTFALFALVMLAGSLCLLPAARRPRAAG